jgi:hypothetical protein
MHLVAATPAAMAPRNADTPVANSGAASCHGATVELVSTVNWRRHARERHSGRLRNDPRHTEI